MRRVGIDLGGTKIEGVVLDDAGSELRRKRISTPTTNDYADVLDAIRALVVELAGGDSEDSVIGVGTPGSCDRETGLMRYSNLTCMNGRPVEEDLKALFAQPLRLANDAKCFALSEACDGAGAGYAVVFGVIMGTGVGGGLIFDGRAHRGADGSGGEWGHNILDTDAPVCYCGQRGCVETLISGPGLVALHERLSGERVTTHELAARAKQGDAVALATQERFLDYFGRALATVINIVDPDAVVLGGGLSNLDCLYNEGAEHIERYLLNHQLRTPILRNRHGDSSGVRGAAQLWRVDELAGH